MPPFSSLDIFVGFAAIAVAGFAVYLFWRASSGPPSREDDEGVSILVEDDYTTSSLISSPRRRQISVPEVTTHLQSTDIERARSNLRTLTLRKELLSMVLRRLFEAEDEGEINRDERVRLSRGYEAELKDLNEELKQSELIMTLHELETIREDILKKFEATLSSTQSRIDQVMKELKIEERIEPPPRTPLRARVPQPEEEPEDEDVEEEERSRAPRARSNVEEKLEQLRNEVLKELEELEKLELEA
jgi:hypothetical protein